ncbi:non-canonical purine NTP pyrophosphatase [Arcobacteraceae bacterium]|nr:non-canonical purine NTP pyrophosphatase [Arcobacteraceae bacterium]
MNIIIASSNKGKIAEIQRWLPEHIVTPYSEILGSFEIEETGITFQENAIIKAKDIVKRLVESGYEKEYIVISDDSGITVPAINNEPNIYSARYAGLDATDKDNNAKLISKLKEKNISKTSAFYTACLAVAYNGKIYTTHGWMHGDVISIEKGDGGFGYDPLFIPTGYTETLGTLDNRVKKELSHRSKALALAMKVISVILKQNIN